MASLRRSGSTSSSHPNTIVESDAADRGNPKYVGKEEAEVTEHELNKVPTKTPQPALLALFERSDKRNLDDIATQPSVFDNPEQAKFHQPHPKYENLHRFDPNFVWTWREERSALRKVDVRVMIWSWIAFLALNLDNSSLVQAQADNFLKDLHLNTNDYNLAIIVFRVGFILSEFPSQLVSKKIGPDRWIPVLTICWGITGSCQFFLSGRGSFLAVRALMGLLQGGFIPDLILYLTYYYKGNELPLRLAILWTADRFKDVAAPLLAFGLLRLRGYHGYEGWRWLFLVVGLINVTIGIIAIFAMAPSPTQTKTWFRPKGWFTEKEEKVLVNRILRDDPSKGDMHNRQPIGLKLLWKSLKDYDLWPIYAIGLTFGIPAGPPKSYLTLTLRGLGFDTFQTNLLSIPAQFLTSITMILITLLSEKINQRALLGLFTQLWFLPCVIALSILPANTDKWSMYALLVVLLSYPSTHPMQGAWCSRNSNSVRTRTISAAVYNMSAQLQSIISANVYREDDKPLYRRGNRVLVGIACLNIVIYVFTKWYYVRRNRKRSVVWDAMSQVEKVRYLNTTEDEGNKRLDFRFVS